tara:strand:+ start:3012 stop:3767 length:756 start_codon:yes stop_codon:yes gene_type:complete
MAQASEEFYKFLGMVSEDLGLQAGDWLARDFENSSLIYTAEHSGEFEESVPARFSGTLSSIFEVEPTELESIPGIRLGTLKQFAKIADPLDDDEQVGFFALENGAATEDFHFLEKARSKHIQAVLDDRREYFGSVMGEIHSLFLKSDPPHFRIRHLATGDLVSCYYRKQDYPVLHNVLDSPNVVLVVGGNVHVDMSSRKFERVEVTKIDVAPEYVDSDIDRLSGALPSITSGMNMQQFIDHLRDGDPEDLH